MIAAMGPEDRSWREEITNCLGRIFERSGGRTSHPRSRAYRRRLPPDGDRARLAGTPRANIDARFTLKLNDGTSKICFGVHKPRSLIRLSANRCGATFRT